MSIDLKQQEADDLLAMEKHRQNDEILKLPDMGGGLIVPLISVDQREIFHLDISRGRINLKKGTYQHRSRTSIILARLDFDGPGHRNPDGEEISSPHLHVYREGYGVKWAFPVSVEQFSDIQNRWQTLLEFMTFCNITQIPQFERGLFT